MFLGFQNILLLTWLKNAINVQVLVLVFGGLLFWKRDVDDFLGLF